MFRFGKLVINYDTAVNLNIPAAYALPARCKTEVTRHVIHWIFYVHDLHVNEYEFKKNINWKIKEGTPAIIKQVSSYIKKHYDIKLPSDIKSAVGNIVSNYLFRSGDYTLKINKSLEWEPGTFGDDGSCFWGDFSVAREMLKNNQALALQIFKDNIPHARAWFAPPSNLDNCYVLFNIYSLAVSGEIIRTMLTDLFGIDCVRVDLENCGSARGPLWINNYSGYLYGPDETIKNMDAIDLGYEDLFKCAHCIETYPMRFGIKNDGYYFCSAGCVERGINEDYYD